MPTSPTFKVLFAGSQRAYKAVLRLLRPHLVAPQSADASSTEATGMETLSKRFELVRLEPGAPGEDVSGDVVLWWVEGKAAGSKYFDPAAVGTSIPVVAVVENADGLMPDARAGSWIFDVLIGDEVTTPLLSRTLRYAVQEAHGQAQRHELATPVQSLQAQTPQAPTLETAAVENQQKFEAIFHNPHTMMLLIDPQTFAIVDANAAACDFYGYTRQEFCAQFITEINIEGPKRVQEAVARVVSGECYRFDFVHRLHDGSTRQVEVHSGPIQIGDKVLLYSVVHDQTERHQISRRQTILSQGLHTVLSAADELLKYKDMDTLMRRTVELAHEKLGLDRCTIFLLDAERDEIQGTFGCDRHRPTTELHAMRYKGIESWLRGSTPRAPGQRWVDFETEFREWDGTRSVSLGRRGWVAVTLMQSEEGVVGSFHNDTAWSGAPLDETQQELVAVYCSVVGNIIQRKRAEERLRAEEERFRLLAENSTDIISRTDAEGIVLYVSPSSRTLLGYEANEVIGASIYQFIHPDDLEETLVFHANPGDLPDVYRRTARTRRKDGSYVWLESIGRPVRNADGQIVEYHIASRDVSARLQAEAARRESDERFRAFMDNTPAMTFIKDPQGRYLYFNKTTSKLFNARLDELTGKTNFDRLPWEVAAQLRENDLKVLGSGEPHEFLEVVPTPDGTDHFWLTFKFPLRDSSGLPLLGGVAVDVTERRRFEEALGRSEERLRTVIDSVPMVIWAIDNEGIFTFSEGKGLQLLGLRGGEMVGRSLFEVYREVPSVLGNARRVLNGEEFSDDVEVEGIVFESRHVPMRDEAGNIIGAIGVATDITERRHAEAELRRSEMQMSEAQQLAHFGSWDWEISSDQFSWSDELYRIYGLEPQSCEITFEGFLQRVHPDDREYVRQVLQNAERHQLPFHFFHRTLRADGRSRILHSRGVTTGGQDGSALRMIGTSQDVTEHKEAEEALQKSEERLRALVHSLDEIVFECDASGRFLSVWTDNENLLGHPRHEILDRTASELWGEEFAQPIVAAFGRVIGECEPETIEYALDVQGGRRWFLARISPIKAPDGTCNSVCMLARDITERREADDQLRRSEERFRLLVEGVKDYAICLLDSQGDIVSWNSGAQRLGGYDGDEILGRHFSCFYSREDIDAGKPHGALEIARHQGRFEDEGPRVRRDGSTFYANVVLTRLVDQNGNERGFAQVTRDISERRQAEQALQHYTARLENLLEIDQAILAARSPREIADVALDRLCEQIGCQHAAVTVFNFESNEAVVLATLGSAEAGLSAGQRFTLSEVVPGAVAIGDESSNGNRGGSPPHFLPSSAPTVPNEVASPDRNPNQNGAGSEVQGEANEREGDEGRNARPEPQSKIFWQQRVERVEGGVPDASQFRSLPLIAQGDLVGVLDLEAEGEEGFPGEGWTIAHEVAGQLAIAVQQARLFEQVRAGRAQLQVLSHRLIQAQEAERRHIARELHDEIGQVLTAVKLNLQGIQRNAQNAPFEANASVEGRLDESIEIVEHALQQVRDLSLNLRPSLLDDLGLAAATRWYVDRLAKRVEMRVRLQIETNERFSSDIETACFRVVQEALTNAGRHARAQNVLVQLRADARQLELTVQDDGKGFEVRAMRERAVRGSSMGLLGMEERALLAGGQLFIESSPDRGTTIRAVFPHEWPDAKWPDAGAPIGQNLASSAALLSEADVDLYRLR